MSLRELDAFEDGLIAEFTGHPVLRAVPELSEQALTEVLLQRRFVSLAFTPAYDLAIDLLTDEPGLRIARVILREEYPGPSGDTPSHREDMREDLVRCGIPRPVVHASRPSPATRSGIESTLGLIAEAGTGEHPNVSLLTLLRFWGEVLVAAEYGALWPRLAPRFPPETPSRFYLPHLVHDAKAHPLGSTDGDTHSDQLGARLCQLLDAPGAQEAFQRTEQRILAIKSGFYDQFLPLD